MLGLAASLAKGGASLLTYVKDNLKLYLDFKSSRSDTLAFPSEGSTSFDGSDDFIDCGELDSNTFTNSYDGGLTMSAWFKTDVIEYAGIMELGLNSSSNFGTAHILVHGDNSQVGLRINNASTSVFSGNNTIVAGQWYHVTTVYDGATNKIKIYLDGEFKAEATASNALDFNSNGRKITLGAYKSSFKLDGQLTNASIWSRALSQEEVQSVMNKSYSQLGSVEKTSLVMWQSLDSVDATGHMETPGTNTSILTSFPTNIYLNSHGTTEYTEVMANNGNLTTQGAWNFQSGGSDSAFADTGVYSEGALKIKNVVIARVAVNSTNDSVLEALIAGQLYKLEITYTRVDGQHAQAVYIGLNSSYGGSGSDVKWKEGYWNTDDDGAAEKTITGYFFHESGKNELWIRCASTSVELHFKTISLKKVTNNAGGGGITPSHNNNHYDATLTQGATTTTSVYGGNSPVLNRAIDIAESFADAIGNGSASFDGSSDYIDLGDSTDFDITNSITLSAWIKVDAINQQAFIAGRDDGTNRNYDLLLWSDNKIYWNCHGLSDTQAGSSTTISANEWYHIAGTYDGSNLKLYINGILEDSDASTGSIDNDDVSFTIGAREAGVDRRLDGNISQVGLWQGALTQAQIQSVMESTSYQKLPADVKSTLGADNLIGTTPTSSTSEIGWDASTKVLTISESRYAFFGNSVTSASKLYKIQYEILTRTSGGLTEAGGSSAFQYGTLPDTIGSHTIYAISRDVAISENRKNIQLLTSSGFRGTIGNISCQEVTHDLVAYYPLDSDSLSTSSRPGNSGDDVVHDSTTGETLGSELIGDPSFEDSSYWGFVGGSGTLDVNTTNAGKLTAINAQDKNLYKGSLLEAGKLYKIQITCDSYTDGNWRLHPSHNASENINFTGAVGVTTVYFVAETTTLQFIFDNNGDWTWTDISVKEVTSNTGVLK